MSESDRSEEVLAQLRASWEPPAGAQERLLAAIHARIDAGGGGGDDGGGAGGSEQLPLGAKLTYFAKVVGASAVMTAAGLALLAGVGAGMREHARAPTHAAERAKPAREPPRALPSLAEADASVPSAPSGGEPAGAEDRRPAAREDAAPPAGARTRENVPKREFPAATQDSTLEAELALLRAARTSAPAEALRALERHAARFPAGILAREREGLRIRALCQLGRSDEAQRLLTPFLAADPESLQLSSLRESCPGLRFSPTDSVGSGD